MEGEIYRYPGLWNADLDEKKCSRCGKEFSEGDITYALCTDHARLGEYCEDCAG
jgi:DNA-directed RNA polymerase subunit RPC12/RpoP